MSFAWTDERVAIVRERWTAGATASQIADELGGEASRNAVIGKVHRLGLSGASKTYLANRGASKVNGGVLADGVIAYAPRRRGRLLAAPSVFPFSVGDQATALRIKGRRAKKVAPQCDGCETDGVADLPPDQSPFAVRLVDHRDGQCRWPLGDPGTDEFRYCGAAIAGAVYCARHHRLAYNRKPSPSRAETETELKYRATVRRGAGLGRLALATLDVNPREIA